MENESRKASLEAVGISCAGPLVRSLAGMQEAEPNADLSRVEPKIPGSDSKVIQRAADTCEPARVSFSVKWNIFTRRNVCFVLQQGVWAAFRSRK